MTSNTSTRSANKAAPRKATAHAEQGATPTAALPKGKLGILVGLLTRPTGATIAEMADAAGWQDHSVRGALAGALKKRGFLVASEKLERVRRYRLKSSEG